MTRRLLAATLAVAGMLALAACTSNPVAPVPDADGTTGTGVGATTEPSATPTPTPTGPTTIPVTLTCDQVVTNEQLYAFNANFAVDPAYAPATGSDAERIVSLQGVSCGWINLSSEDTVEVAVAHLGDSDIEALKNELVLSTPSVPTYGGVDYFAVDEDGVGEANVFDDDYWIVVRSIEFFEPGDAAQLVESIKANLT